VKSLEAGGNTHKYFGLGELNDPRLGIEFIIKRISLSVLESY
jgi:hypothetical protein